MLPTTQSKSLVAIVLGMIIVGCTSSMSRQPSPRAADPVLASTADSEKGPAQLWEENCNRCHNYRPADTYSDVQWTVVMHHMRVRANLTAHEEKQILEFLQASN